MPWKLIIAPRAERDLAALRARDREAIRQVLRRLANAPDTTDLKKLGGRCGEWRVRVGRWRLILELNNATGEMSVTRVLPRKDAYR